MILTSIGRILMPSLLKALHRSYGTISNHLDKIWNKIAKHKNNGWTYSKVIIPEVFKEILKIINFR